MRHAAAKILREKTAFPPHADADVSDASGALPYGCGPAPNKDKIMDAMHPRRVHEAFRKNAASPQKNRLCSRRLVTAACAVAAGASGAPAAGRRSRRKIEGIGRSVGQTAGAAGNHLFRVRGMALGAGRLFVAEDEILKGMIAGFAAIFVNRHGIRLLSGPR